MWAQWRGVLIPVGIAAALWLLGIVQLDVTGGLPRAGAGSQRCRPTSAESAMVEVASVPGEETPTPTPVTTPIITTELAVLASARDIPILLPSLVVRAPANHDSEVNALLHTSLSAVEPSLVEGRVPLSERNTYRSMLYSLLVNDPEDAEDLGLFVLGVPTGATPTAASATPVAAGATPVGSAATPVGGAATPVPSERATPLAATAMAGSAATPVAEPPLPADVQTTLDADQDARDAGAMVADALALGRPPVVVVGENGTVTLAVAANPEPLADNSPVPSGGWTVASTGRDVQFRIAGQPPENTAWEIEVCTEGLSIAAADLVVSPSPASAADAPRLVVQNATRVQWEVPPSNLERRVDVQVMAQAPPLVALRMAWFSDYRIAAAATALGYLVPALLILAGLLLVSRFSVVNDDFESAKARLSAATWAIVRVTVAAIVSLFTVGQVPLPPEWTPRGTGALVVVGIGVVVLGLLEFRPGLIAGGNGRWAMAVGSAAVAAGSCLIASVFLSEIYLNAIHIPALKVWPVVQSALLVAGYTMFLATAIDMWRQRMSAAFAPMPRVALAAVGALSLVGIVLLQEVSVRRRGHEAWRLAETQAIPLWVTAAFVIGFILMAGALLHGALAGRIPDRVPLWLRRVGLIAATALVLVAVLAQWGWAQFSREEIWWRAPVEAAPRDYFPEFYRDRLLWLLSEYVKSFFVPTSDLLLVLGLIGILGALRATGLAGASPFLGANGRWLRRTLALLFAAFVVGYGGEVLGFRAPVAFFVALFLMQLVWSNRLEVISDAIDQRHRRTAGAAPLIVTERKGLLERAMAFADLAYRRDEAHREYVARTGDATSEQYLTTLNELDAEADALWADRPIASAAAQTAGPAGPAGAAVPAPTPAAAQPRRRRRLRLKPEETPGELAIALGPRPTWWGNGVVAAKLGGMLAILPIAYFVYVFFTSPAAGGWSLNTPFAIAGFASALISEAAFWLVAAFVFGCLFPYLKGHNGLTKGLVLTAVYVTAHAVAALLGIPSAGLWQVRSFQLLLYLMLLGALLDRQTVQQLGLHWRYLVAHYDLPKASGLVSQAVPLAAALLGVIAQLYAGQTEEATRSLVGGEAMQAIVQAAQRWGGLSGGG